MKTPNQMKEKKILFITHLYYPALGGAERVFRQLAEGLVAKGWQVTVLTSDALSTEHYFTTIQNNLASKEIINGVEVIRESIQAPVYKAFKVFDRLARRAGRMGVFFRPLVFGPHFSGFRRKIGKFFFPFVIAGPVPTTAPFYGLLYKFFHPSSRLIILSHMHIKDRLHKTQLNLMAIRRADFVLTTTPSERKFLLAHKVNEKKVGLFFNAVDNFLLKSPSPLNPPSKKSVLYLGQEGEHKRIPLLLNAMLNLWEEGMELELWIAGARTQYSWTIDRLIEKLPAKYRHLVSRFNNISEEEKVSLIDRCFVLVNPSSYESFGLVFLEAWARRKPVIGARIPAVRDIIQDGVDGLLFEDKNEADLKNKIKLLLQNEELALRMGEKGQEKVLSCFTQEKVIATLENYLLNLP